MGGLPSVPNLDPNAPQGAGESDPPAPTAEAAAQKTDASPLPSPAPAGANVAPEPAAAPGADPGTPIPKPGSVSSQATPKPVPAPGAPPVNGSPESEVGPVQDSVEEVLQQSADQALRLSHLEDILTALNLTLTDIRDEMHAGFAEIRAVIEDGGTTGQRPTEATFKSSLTERFDFVEEQTVQGNKRQSTLILIAIVQAILLVVTLAVVVLTRDGNEPDLPQPSYMSTGDQPTDAAKTVTPPPVDTTRPKAKRKRGRRR